MEFGSLIVSCFLYSPAQGQKRHLSRMKQFLVILLCLVGNMSAKSWTKGLMVHWVSKNPSAILVFNEKTGKRIGDLKNGRLHQLFENFQIIEWSIRDGDGKVLEKGKAKVGIGSCGVSGKCNRSGFRSLAASVDLLCDGLVKMAITPASPHSQSASIDFSCVKHSIGWSTKHESPCSSQAPVQVRPIDAQ